MRHGSIAEESMHVVPIGDLIDHDTETTDCVCGPDLEPVQHHDDTYGWVVVHHSLDGREANE